ncbi:sugar transferase [Tropicibacter sp. R16_0]|uniref:sugar transferase n=1 Tax=Tropicibacter sp. R16_0 TaxID=2821102 RepID=UPI001ADD5C36|nr:sugar transferase [Tropicibacter sp. R16_0]MBO9450814.1 sugar transferase [Tropicibacter sp. R16_0]
MTMTSLAPTKRRRLLPKLNAKRVLDLSLVTLILLAVWPVLAVVAGLVAITSRGPVFFVQTRVGLYGRSFRMLKFRSMYQDAEARREQLIEQSERDGVCFKLKSDPRVTPVGQFIRRWSLDELPQLFNVLKGDMSLVGPRPALPQEVAAYPAKAHGRHSVLPGITGLWQVSGRADIGFDEMIALDLTYARNVSVLTDIQIMFRTFNAVLSGRGAY